MSRQGVHTIRTWELPTTRGSAGMGCSCSRQMECPTSMIQFWVIRVVIRPYTNPLGPDFPGVGPFVNPCADTFGGTNYLKVIVRVVGIVLVPAADAPLRSERL